MQCAVNGCPHRVMKTDLGWEHVDTHGVLVEHKAVPKRTQEAPPRRLVCPRCSSIVDDLGVHMKEMHSAAGA